MLKFRENELIGIEGRKRSESLETFHHLILRILILVEEYGGSSTLSVVSP